MAKPGFWSDTLEQLAELGHSTVKNTAKGVVETFNPLSVFNTSEKAPAAEENRSEKKHTPLDLQKLQEQYQNQDKLRVDALRNRFFQRVKGDDERLLNEKKQMAEQAKTDEEEQKQAKPIEKPPNMEIPQGKERRNIFGRKKRKMAEPQPAEIKPATGKQ